MKIRRYKGERGQSIQVCVLGRTFDVYWSQWTGYYGFEDSKGYSLQFTYYKDHA